MTQQITLPREIVEQLVVALETGADLARNHAEDVHESYKGYYPERHAAADRDVADMEAAITAVRAALANAERVEHVPHVRGAMIWSKPK